MDNSTDHNRMMLWVVNSTHSGINDCISKTKLLLQTTLNLKKKKGNKNTRAIYLLDSYT